MKYILTVLGFLICSNTILPQESTRSAVPDTNYSPEIKHPAYTENGPVVLLDEAHHNYHTMTTSTHGRFKPFAKLLKRDGYQVKPNRKAFTQEILAEANILVISNALHESEASGDWTKPNPAAFSAEEVESVRNWVYDGGSLLLIADHQPFPAAAEYMGRAFGFQFVNEWVVDTTANPFKKQRRPIGFFSSNNTLRDHPIRLGRSEAERVDSVTTFTGQAFLCDECEPLLVFTIGPRSFRIEHPRDISDSTRSFRVDGWLQGAAKRFGKGRVVVFGEAAAFSAQIIKEEGKPDRYAGMNREIAKQNYLYLLNVMHWLSGLLD